MSAPSFGSNSDKPTQSTGNAGGKPIVPILFGVGAVIALIIATIVLQKQTLPTRENEGYSAAGPIPAVRYSPAPVAGTATGKTGEQAPTVLPSGPATAPVASPAPGNSVSGSSAMPVSTVPDNATGAASGRSIVAPPAPAGNGTQENNR